MQTKRKSKGKVMAAVVTAITLMSSSFATLRASAFVDPNGDGKLTLQDAIFISKYLCGKVYTDNLASVSSIT